jgi:hypothetical protein
MRGWGTSRADARLGDWGRRGRTSGPLAASSGSVGVQRRELAGRSRDEACGVQRGVVTRVLEGSRGPPAGRPTGVQRPPRRLQRVRRRPPARARRRGPGVHPAASSGPVLGAVPGSILRRPAGLSWGLSRGVQRDGVGCGTGSLCGPATSCVRRLLPASSPGVAWGSGQPFAGWSSWGSLVFGGLAGAWGLLGADVRLGDWGWRGAQPPVRPSGADVRLGDWGWRGRAAGFLQGSSSVSVQRVQRVQRACPTAPRGILEPANHGSPSESAPDGDNGDRLPAYPHLDRLVQRA